MLGILRFFVNVYISKKKNSKVMIYSINKEWFFCLYFYF